MLIVPQPPPTFAQRTWRALHGSMKKIEMYFDVFKRSDLKARVLRLSPTRDWVQDGCKIGCKIMRANSLIMSIGCKKCKIFCLYIVNVCIWK